MSDNNLEQLLSRFFEEPGGHVVMDKDLRVVEVGQEYLRLTMGRKEDVVDKLYINTISEPDEGRHEAAIDMVRRLSAAAFKTHQTQKYGPIRSDVRSSVDGHIEERWWRGAFVPVIDGGAEYLVHRIEDVTTENKVERSISAQRRSNYILYLLVVALLGITSGLLYSDLSSRSQSNQQLALKTCQQVQAINNRLYIIIKNQEIQILTPGTATYKFYSQHLDLRREALISTYREEQTFYPRKCKS